MMSVTLHDGAGNRIRLTFHNPAPEDHFLAVRRTGEGAFDGDYFQFDPEGPAYLGVSVKRAAFEEEDLVRVGAGETLSSVVDLTELYDGLAGAQRLRYCATHPLHGRDRPGTLLVSEWVSLTH